jgi:predicted nuclease of predicted toxin-antitoxin system
MILIDANQVGISTLMAESRGKPIADLDLMRHMFLVSIRNIRKKFKDYGEVVLCWDAGNYWRKDIFPYYKASRKKTREESDVDWDKIFENLHAIRKEISENFPYRVMKVERCEADDIIATLTKQYAQAEDIVIVSSDEDFLQLQVYPRVRQWSIIKSQFLKCENAKDFLARKIMRGDTGDGVPNFLSDDDCFVDDGKRQKPLLEKKMTAWLSDPLNREWDDRMVRNHERNEALVSLFKIPTQYTDAIFEEYEKPKVEDRSKILPYFIANRMRLLIEHIEDF